MSWSQQRRQTIRFILHKQKKKTECSAIRELKVQSNTQYLTNNNIGLRSKLRPKLNLISLLSPYDWHSFGKYFATMTSCRPRLVDTWTVYATGDHISIHSWGKHMKTNIDVIHRCHCLIPFNFLIGAIDDSDNKWRQHFYWAISLEFYENFSKSIIEKKRVVLTPTALWNRCDMTELCKTKYHHASAFGWYRLSILHNTAPVTRCGDNFGCDARMMMKPEGNKSHAIFSLLLSIVMSMVVCYLIAT